MDLPKNISEWFDLQPDAVTDVKLAIQDKSFSNREIEESFLQAERDVLLGNVFEDAPQSRSIVNPLVEQMFQEA